MIDAAQRLRDALVAAFRPWVAGRLEHLGVEASPALDAALADGERWLTTSLGDLLSRPFEDQHRGPLEVFQESMRFPTAALEAEGVAAVERDEAARAALPGDVYDLAPASSASLAEEAWRAHMQWGAAKAASFLGET